MSYEKLIRIPIDRIGALIGKSGNTKKLIEKISSLPKNSTSIVKYIQDQKKLLDDTKIVEDSLFYEGIPLLNKVFPKIFSMGQIYKLKINNA